MSTYIFVFDVDGVLIDSEKTKLAAFLDAVTGVCNLDPSTVEAVALYHMTHQGIPRQMKIEHVVGEIIGGSSEDASAVAASYASILAERLPFCPMMRGVEGFLSAASAACYVASSAPVAEIRNILERHNLLSHFSGVYGYPPAKAQTLADLKDKFSPAEVVFFGNAAADWDAALIAGVHFVAVNPTDELRRSVSGWVADFADIDQVMTAVYSAG